jgi:hypothetical protein
MVKAFTILSYDLDIDEETDEVFLTIVGAGGRETKRSLGEFRRDLSNEDQKKLMFQMQDKADKMRAYYVANGSLPQ